MSGSQIKAPGFAGGYLLAVKMLGLKQLCHLIMVLGAYADEVANQYPKQIAGMQNLQVAQRITNAAAAVIVDWPVGFHALLDRIQIRHASETSKTSLPKQYGYLYSYVFGRMPARKFDFLRSAFEQHIVEHWLQPLTERNKRISAEKRGSSVWLPAHVAAKQLGTTRHQLALLFNAGIISLSARKADSGRTVLCVDRDMLPDIKILLDDLIDLQAAGKVLNLRKGRMYQLLSHRIVNAVTEPKHAREGKWGISRKSLQALLLVGDGLPSTESVADISIIRMDYVLRHWLKIELLFPLLIESVCNKEILPIAVSPELPGIPGWVFNSDQLKQWCDEKTKTLRSGALTITQAAKQLRLNQQAVYHLVKVGLLKTTIVDGDAAHPLITENELRRFNEIFVLSRELAELIGTSAPQATRMLQRQRVKAVCGKEIDGCVQYVYRRGEALEGILLKIGIISGQMNKPR